MKEGFFVKETIKDQAARLFEEFLEAAKLPKGSLVVVGCSSSEIVGQKIGTCSSTEAAQAVFSAFSALAGEAGVSLAAQCCEHLNRALILERADAVRFGYEEVNVVPHPHAGGAFATVAYQQFQDPVAVEHIRADAGIDIGGTLIGMHLKEVVVPVRVSLRQIGEANVLLARTRRKFIGGERAHYDPALF